jgi:hypothetical protein
VNDSNDKLSSPSAGLDCDSSHPKSPLDRMTLAFSSEAPSDPNARNLYFVPGSGAAVPAASRGTVSVPRCCQEKVDNVPPSPVNRRLSKFIDDYRELLPFIFPANEEFAPAAYSMTGKGRSRTARAAGESLTLFLEVETRVNPPAHCVIDSW